MRTGWAEAKLSEIYRGARWMTNPPAGAIVNGSVSPEATFFWRAKPGLAS